MFSSENATYPTDPVPFDKPIPYASGSFLFQAPTTVLSSPVSGSHLVTIDASGYDLSEHNDFAIQALSSVSGTITAPASAGASPTPANGVVVHLSSAGAVVGSTTTDASGSYSFSDVEAGTYTVSQEVPAGLVQTTPAQSNLVLATPATGANVFQLPNGYQAVNTVVDDFNANGKPDIAVLGWNSGASITANTPIVFIYFDGATTNSVSLDAGVSLGPGDIPEKMVDGYTDGSTLSLTVLFSQGQVIRFDQAGGAFNQSGSLIANLPMNAGIYQYINLVVGNFDPSKPSDQLNYVALTENVVSGGSSTGYSLVEFGQGKSPAVIATSGPGFAFDQLIAADVDGNGSTDLIVGGGGGSPVIYYSRPGGSFRAVTLSSLPPGHGYNSTSLVVGDINGDGLLDIGETIGDGTFRFILQTASGGFSTPVAVPICCPDLGVGAVLLADVNGDRRPDLIYAASGGSAPNR